jgi:hypothetical protein
VAVAQQALAVLEDHLQLVAAFREVLVGQLLGSHCVGLRGSEIRLFRHGVVEGHIVAGVAPTSDAAPALVQLGQILLPNVHHLVEERQSTFHVTLREEHIPQSEISDRRNDRLRTVHTRRVIYRVSEVRLGRIEVA